MLRHIITENGVKIWAGFIWLMIDFICEIYEVINKTLVLPKRQGI
jgi:hypothetical protein